MASTSMPTPWPVSSLRQICYGVPSSQTSLVQACVYLHVHVAAQGIGDGTALISLLRGVLESFGVEAGDPPLDVEDQRGNLQLVDMEGARTLLQIPPPHNIGAPFSSSHVLLPFIRFLRYYVRLPVARAL